MWQVEVSHKSEMAGLFNRGDTIINKHFTLLYFLYGDVWEQSVYCLVDVRYLYVVLEHFDHKAK